jgi:hypothetical protein
MTQIVKTGASREFLGRDNGETKVVPFGCDVSNVGMPKKPAACGVYLDRRSSNVEEVVRLCCAGEERSAATPFDQGCAT